MSGVNFNPLSLYPLVKYPVSSGTPMISSFVRWDHSISWDVPRLDQFGCGAASSSASTSFTIDAPGDPEDAYLFGHAIDGRVLFPATGYLVLAWKTLAKMNNQIYDEMAVTFDDVQIHRATILPQTGEKMGVLISWVRLIGKLLVQSFIFIMDYSLVNFTLLL